MHKKFQAFFLCAALSISLAACSGQDSLNCPNGDVLSKEEGGSADDQDAQGGSQDQETEKDGQDSGNGSEETADSRDQADSQKDEGKVEDMEPLLGPDATDEELLEVLKDDTTVVTDADYVAMIHSFQEETNDHVGKIYQIEGVYVVEEGVPYLSRTVVDGESQTPCRIPLKYVTEELEEGAWICATGILNRGDVGGNTVPLLEVAVLQLPETPGQAELPAQ